MSHEQLTIEADHDSYGQRRYTIFIDQMHFSTVKVASGSDAREHNRVDQLMRRLALAWNCFDELVALVDEAQRTFASQVDESPNKVIDQLRRAMLAEKANRFAAALAKAQPQEVRRG